MRVTTWSAALLCGMALALPVVAQEDAIPKELPPAPSEPTVEPVEPAPSQPPPKKSDFGDPPLHRWGGWTIALSAWEPSLVGADEELATTYQNGIGYPLMAGSTSRIRETVAAIYHLPHDIGSIGASYDSMYQSDSFEDLTPSQFVFGETRAYPVAFGVNVLGAFNDGFADGVSADIVRKTREFRLWYSQTAFESPRAKGTWAVGYRQVSHSRNLGIAYLAIVPNLPPVIPPVVPDNADTDRLKPFPDSVSQTSNFYGHGLGVSFDLEFPVHPRVSVISGLSIGLIRGSASSEYISRAAYYFLAESPDVPLPTDELIAILDDPCEATDPTCTGPGIEDVGQTTVVHGVSQAPTSQFAETLDIYVGLEVKVYRGLKVFGTLRDVYYANVGEYVVPRPDFANERSSLSAGYEGYTLGLSWRF